MTEADVKQKEKEEALQRRKEELEEELDRYAQAGAFSPGLLKFTKWLSRGLYLAMAIAFMVMLFSGWGKVSKEEFDKVHEGYTKWKKEAEDEKAAREEAQNMMLAAEIRAAKLKLELEEAKAGGSEEADAAQEKARSLIERAWGEKAYAEHWRQKLPATSPEGDGTAAVRALIEQAARATAGERFELLRETAEFGQQAIEQAGDSAMKSADPEVRKIAARLLARIGKPVDPKTSPEQDDGVLRELWFNCSVTLQYRGGIDTYYAEAFVGAALSMTPLLQEFDEAYRNAPEANRMELIALYAECAARDDSGLFKMIATSQRPLAEKIVAVRWMGTRKDEGSRALLQTLSEGNDALANEAKEALKKLNG